ncbi:hypothetical protein MLD38_036747 [Melastoma candidum]|uniref:Uncharacterized protein n=1 Tax=Melastoma candidum TaxID=119954 RepID=A0ACB9LMI0_9MYRT|nr:hypothetical protein MLD38_036747 [Melastoma candidum]
MCGSNWGVAGLRIRLRDWSGVRKFIEAIAFGRWCGKAYVAPEVEEIADQEDMTETPLEAADERTGDFANVAERNLSWAELLAEVEAVKVMARRTACWPICRASLAGNCCCNLVGSAV